MTTGTGLPTFTDYIALDGQIVAQRSVQYAGSPAWGGATWGAFKWGPAAPAVAAWNAFNWGSTNWSGVAWGGFKWGAAPWSGPVVNWAYFTLDHLGSVAVVANQSGNVIQRLSYDAWGKQRHADGTDATCGAITSTTTRGFTNQEQMPAGCIVNLNARLYDPSIGKFMAADSIVPNAFDGQSYNRYAYVTNNPLSFTDVTGHALGCAETTYCSSIVYYVPGGGTTSNAGDAGGAMPSGQASGDNNRPLLPQTEGYATNPSGVEQVVVHGTGAGPEVIGTADISSWANATPISPGVEQVTVTETRSKPIRVADAGTLTFVAPLIQLSPNLFRFSPVAIIGCGLLCSTPAGENCSNPTALGCTGHVLNMGSNPKPAGVPTGTKPIDQAGLTRPEIHDIKDELKLGAKDWVGISPDGHVIIDDGEGHAEDVGHVDDILSGRDK